MIPDTTAGAPPRAGPAEPSGTDADTEGPTIPQEKVKLLRDRFEKQRRSATVASPSPPRRTKRLELILFKRPHPSWNM